MTLDRLADFLAGLVAGLAIAGLVELVVHNWNPFA